MDQVELLDRIYEASRTVARMTDAERLQGANAGLLDRRFLTEEKLEELRDWVEYSRCGDESPITAVRCWKRYGHLGCHEFGVPAETIRWDNEALGSGGSCT